MQYRVTVYAREDTESVILDLAEHELDGIKALQSAMIDAGGPRIKIERSGWEEVF